MNCRTKQSCSDRIHKTKTIAYVLLPSLATLVTRLSDTEVFSSRYAIYTSLSFSDP